MSPKRFATYAWSVLGYILLVVAWGAYVRATGSGAGCGSHWPLCNGEVLPREPRLETLIEFSHRISSGLALVAIALLLVFAFRVYPGGHLVRKAATVTFGLIVLEALLGAGLVLFELVADNASMVRALSMIAHLVNTFFLIGSLTLTAWWASGQERVSLRGHRNAAILVGAGLVGVLAVGATGAIAALGDTLFPSASFAEGFQADLSPTAHFLLRLRVFHPLIAIAVGGYLLVMVRAVFRLRPSLRVARLSSLVTVGVLLQLAAGGINLALLAPVWMQLVHLLMADLIWIALVVFGASALAAEPVGARAATPHRPLVPVQPGA